MSQRTENNYYGKPCGLMDQAAERDLQHTEEVVAEEGREAGGHRGDKQNSLHGYAPVSVAPKVIPLIKEPIFETYDAEEEARKRKRNGCAEFEATEY